MTNTGAVSGEQNAPVLQKRMLFGAAIFVGAILLFNALSDGKKDESTDQKVPKPITLGTDPVNTITVQDQDAALTQFAKKIESQELKIETLERKNEEQRLLDDKKRREIEQRLNTEVRTLSEALAQQRKDQIEGTYQAVNAADNDPVSLPATPDGLPPMGTMEGLNFDGLNLDMTSPTPSKSVEPRAPFGPNYFILRPQMAAPVATSKSGGGINASEEELFAAMGQPNASDFNSTPYNYPGAPGVQTSQQPPQQNQQPGNQVQPVATNPVQELPARETETIPAFSFVEVTTLHGVACPVGANAPGSSSDKNIPARPVVLPVRGIFRGPNGSAKDTGTIHLMGLCSGRRTSSSNSGRATIRVEQMSYWDASGGAQMVATTGYIVDTRDNEQDVYGRLDKTSGRTLALQSAAAAAAAYATTLSQAEFTTQNNLTNEGTSTATSQLTGDSTKAAMSQGVAALFTKIGQRFEAEANAAVDTVIVEPGIKLRFVTDQPISILKPAEQFNLDGTNNDVLL